MQVVGDAVASAVNQILSLDDTQDGPTKGVAELDGSPVLFERVFDEARDQYTDVFEIRPLPPEAAGLAREQDAIFGRWLREFKAGRVGVETHPALPDETRRSEELREQFETWWEAGAQAARRVKAFCHATGVGSRSLAAGWTIEWVK
jgi:hypothetical protein